MATTADLLAGLKQKIITLGEQQQSGYYFSNALQMYYTENMEFSIESPPRLTSCANLLSVKFLNGVKKLQQQHLFGCSNLQYLYLPNTLTWIGSGTAQFNCPNLKIIDLEDGFNCNGCVFGYSTLYSKETILNMLNALADRTGDTAYTLTLGTENLAKLTEEEKQIATNKNWNLA